MLNTKNIKSFTVNFIQFFVITLKNLGWKLVAGLCLAIDAIFFFGWLASEIIESETRVFDDGIRNFFHQIASPNLTNVMIFFTYVGSAYGIIFLLIIAITILLYKNHKRSAALLIITMIGESVLSFILKLSFQRPRPEAYFDFKLPTSFSFPSGHAFASLCFFGALALFLNAQITNRFQKIAIWLISIWLFLIIGISRIYLGVHYPSDVIAGYAAGFVWLFTIYFADNRLRERQK
jgi:undecaprenyl-diphosphatase